MRSSKPRKSVGRPIKASPITERQEALYAFLNKVPSLPTHSHPAIIEALIKQIEGHSRSEAEYVRYLLRVLAIGERLVELNAPQPHMGEYDRLLSLQVISELLTAGKRLKHQHNAAVIQLQRDFLVYLFKGDRNLLDARTWSAQKLYLKKHDNEILRVLKAFPCWCTYADSISGIDRTTSAPHTPKELMCQILANLHRSTRQGIAQRLKALHKHSE